MEDDRHDVREARAKALLNEVAVAVKTAAVPDHAPVRVEQVLTGADAVSVEDVHTVAWRDLLSAKRQLARVDPDHHSHAAISKKVAECERVEGLIDAVRSDRELMESGTAGHDDEQRRVL